MLKAALVILSPLVNSLHSYRVADGRKLLQFMQRYIPEGTIIRVTDKSYRFQNDDDTVNVSDLGILAGCWGETQQPYPVPEPSALLLLSLGAASLGVHTWRRRQRR